MQEVIPEAAVIELSGAPSAAAAAPTAAPAPADQLAVSYQDHLFKLLSLADNLTRRLRQPAASAAVIRQEEQEALLVHQLLLEVADRVPASATALRQASSNGNGAGAALPKSCRASHTESAPPLDSIAAEALALPPLQPWQAAGAGVGGAGTAHHKHHRSINLSVGDRELWADYLADLVLSILPPK